MRTEEFLSQLEGVRKTREGQYLACCPSHDDRSPSLSVKEGDDGTTVIHCFAGCPPDEVVAAVGLEIGDLFPEKLEPHKGRKPYWNPKDILLVIKDEAIVSACAAGRMGRGEDLSPEELDRVQKASQRIYKALEVANVR